MPKNLKNVIIKKANKRSCIVIWDRNELFTGSGKKKKQVIKKFIKQAIVKIFYLNKEK